MILNVGLEYIITIYIYYCTCIRNPYTNKCSLYICLTWRWAGIAVAERISSEALRAGTDRSMIYNNTLCASTTWSRAWILTFFPYACPVALTFRVNTALRSAIWWNSHIVRQAGARRSTSNVSALRVWSTWRWHTWVYRLWRWSLNNSCSKRKVNKIPWHNNPSSLTVQSPRLLFSD